MNWEKILNSKVVTGLGVSIVFIIASYFIWIQMNVHVNGRLESQDKRITDMQMENLFYRDFMEEEQAQRRTLFTAIEEHLKELAKRRVQ